MSINAAIWMAAMIFFFFFSVEKLDTKHFNLDQVLPPKLEPILRRTRKTRLRLAAAASCDLSFRIHVQTPQADVRAGRRPLI